MMFYVEENNKIVLFDEDIHKLINTLALMPQYQGLEVKETDRPIIDFQFADTEEFINEQTQKECERINNLTITKSDFFDETIKAFGMDQRDLEPVVDALLNTLPLSNVEKKIAMNNFQNAKDFYRHHALFNILSDKEITLSEEQKIKITSEQWDRFFDKKAKGDNEAYKELLPIEEVAVNATTQEDISNTSETLDVNLSTSINEGDIE